MGKIALILGGARSGKSTFAEELAARRAEDVTYIATAEPMDEEMHTRIQAHRRQRPPHWHTREIPLRVAETLSEKGPAGRVVLLDCMTMLVSNLSLAHMQDIDAPDEAGIEAAVEAEIDALLSYIDGAEQDWIIVSNEVGMGVVPAYPLGRVYRDVLGRANRQAAAAADETYLMVAGLPLALHKLAPEPD